MNVLFLLKHVTRDLNEILHKTFSRGPRAGWVCAKTHALNALNVVRGRVTRRLRVECPCCGWRGYAFSAIDGEICVLPQAICPQCFAQERHRMIQVFFDRRPEAFLPSGGRVLHFAPEMSVRNLLLRRAGNVCVSTDLAPDKLLPLTGARFRADAQALPLRDGMFDAIAMLHMLEHVDDDRRALREIRRVLKPGGQALIMVPFGMHLERTIEYGRGNEVMFGHVRDYSPKDFSARLEGFSFQSVTPGDLMTEEEQFRFGIPASQIIFLCEKQ